VSARSSEGNPTEFAAGEFQGLLQRFVNEQYRKGFETIGDEADFDHAHLLFGAGSERPLAILYHTRELSSLAHKDRNWLQWVGRGTVENAALYERRSYPAGPSWEWFQEMELSGLRRHNTILDKMLDPAKLGSELRLSRQWVFTRIDCAAPGATSLQVRLPDGQKVCLALTQD
jgi:hypothetical protein